MGTETSQADVVQPLLAHLRAELDRPGLSFAEPPEPLTGGFETLSCSMRLAGAPGAWQQPLILRVFAHARAPGRARYEAALQNAIAGQGYPAPRVLLHCDTDAPLGCPFLIMERLPGVVMAQALRSPLRARSLGALLAEAQARLHELDAARVLATLQREQLAPFTVDDMLAQLGLRIDDASLDTLRPGLNWLLARPPEREPFVICHGDYHPNNVLVHDGAVSGVIDWSLVTFAPAEYDVGNTRAILANAPRGVPALIDPVAGLAIRSVMRRYTAAYRKTRPLNMDAVRYYEALRCLQSLVWAGEAQRALAAGVDPGPVPWLGRAQRRLLSQLRSVTGLRLTLPP
jgi:aminoglycoside phosphotransferase (APT) family kinase protein